LYLVLMAASLANLLEASLRILRFSVPFPADFN